MRPYCSPAGEALNRHHRLGNAQQLAYLHHLLHPLFLPRPLDKVTGNDLSFSVIMVAVIAALNEHGDLLCMSITIPGNKFSLWAIPQGVP